MASGRVPMTKKMVGNILFFINYYSWYKFCGKSLVFGVIFNVAQ